MESCTTGFSCHVQIFTSHFRYDQDEIQQFLGEMAIFIVIQVTPIMLFEKKMAISIRFLLYFSINYSEWFFSELI